MSRNGVRRLADLADAPYNPRRIEADRLATLGRLMREHGDLSGIVFNRRTGRLIGGHQRKQHLPPDAEVHVTERPTRPNAQGTVAVGYVVADGERWAYREVDVDEQREAAMNVAANKGGLLAEFDMPKLADLLSTLDAEGYDATLTGFDAKELEDLLTWAPDGGKAEDPDIDLTPPAEPKSQRGEVYELGRHRVMCGDATSAEDVGRLMAGERAALVVTSPPYNQKIDQFQPSGMHTQSRWVANVRAGGYFDSKPEPEYQADQIKALRLWAEHLTPVASVFYNHKNRYRGKQVVSPWAWLAESGAKVRQEIIWRRPGSVTQNARMFLPCDERIFWLYFGDDFYFNDSTEHKSWSSVWDIVPQVDREESQHGCAFPVELPARCIRACSKPGDIVLEPYGGSGTTLIAAEQNGRTCYAMEIDPRYVDVIRRRYARFVGRPELES